MLILGFMLYNLETTNTQIIYLYYFLIFLAHCVIQSTWNVRHLLSQKSEWQKILICQVLLYFVFFFIPNISVFTHFFCSEKERKMRYYQAAFKKYQISGENFVVLLFCYITNYKNEQIFYFLLISTDFFLYLGI